MSCRTARQARIGFFSGSVGDKTTMLLRADRAAPRPSVPEVSMVSTRMANTAGVVVAGAAWGIAIGAPGTDHLVMDSTTVDQILGNGPQIDPASRVLVTLLPDDTTALTSTIRGYQGTSPVYQSPVDGGAIGDAHAVGVPVLHRTATSMTISIPATAIATGDLVTTPTGLVGTVAATTSADATVRLTTTKGFAMSAMTSLSDHPGVLTGTGTTVMFTAIHPSDQINTGNRVVVQDPLNIPRSPG